MEILIVFIVLYFLPTIIAMCRSHASLGAIIAVNVLLGWSLIGWFWAFIWSLANKGGSQNVSVINQVNNNGNS